MDVRSVFAMNSDGAYSLLYQNKEMVELLVKHWLPAGLADEIDFATLREESPKQYDEDGRLRVGDLAFTALLKGEPSGWATLPLEFQSTQDFEMPWRMSNYAWLLWRRLHRANRLRGGKFPGVVPIVIYTGARPWGGGCELAQCIGLPPGSQIWATTPSGRIYVVDVKRQDPAHLERLDNPVAWAMLLEPAADTTRMKVLAEKIDTWADRQSRRSTWEAFAVLMRELVTAGRVRGEPLKCRVATLELTEEERGMSLAENLDYWREQWVDEGEHRGLERGLRTAVEVALELKFGDLGARFWKDHLSALDIAPWGEILQVIRETRTIDALHRFKPKM